MRRLSAVQDLEVTLVGAGRSGSFVAMVLAMLGAGVRLYDPDALGPENQGKQLYRRPDVAARRPKVRALRSLLRAVVPGARVRGHAERFDGAPVQARSPIVVVTVDTMHERRRIWEALGGAPDLLLFLDVRLGPGQVRLHEVRAGEPEDAEEYAASLHADPQAGTPACDQAASAHAAAAAAALVGGALAAWADGLPRPRWIGLDLDRAQWTAGRRGSAALY